MKQVFDHMEPGLCNLLALDQTQALYRAIVCGVLFCFEAMSEYSESDTDMYSSYDETWLALFNFSEVMVFLSEFFLDNLK